MKYERRVHISSIFFWNTLLGRQGNYKDAKTPTHEISKVTQIFSTPPPPAGRGRESPRWPKCVKEKFSKYDHDKTMSKPVFPTLFRKSLNTTITILVSFKNTIQEYTKETFVMVFNDSLLCFPTLSSSRLP